MKGSPAKYILCVGPPLLCTLVAVYIVLSVLASMSNNTTEIGFHIRPQGFAPQVSRCIANIMDDEEGGRLRLRLWFEPGDGTVLIEVRGDLIPSNDKLQVLSASQLEPYDCPHRDGMLLATFFLDSMDSSSYIDQTFTGAILRKRGRSNRIRFVMDGVSSPVQLQVEGLGWMTVKDIYPVPNSRMPNQMGFQLDGHPEFPKLRTAYFTVADDREQLSRDRFAFGGGIVCGLLCSVLAAFIYRAAKPRDDQ